MSESSRIDVSSVVPSVCPDREPDKCRRFGLPLNPQDTTTCVQCQSDPEIRAQLKRAGEQLRTGKTQQSAGGCSWVPCRDAGEPYWRTIKDDPADKKEAVRKCPEDGRPHRACSCSKCVLRLDRIPEDAKVVIDLPECQHRTRVVQPPDGPTLINCGLVTECVGQPVGMDGRKCTGCAQTRDARAVIVAITNVGRLRLQAGYGPGTHGMRGIVATVSDLRRMGVQDGDMARDLLDAVTQRRTLTATEGERVARLAGLADVEVIG